MLHVIVHNLTQTQAALRASARTGRTLVLNSAPGAAQFLGTGYFLAMIAAARRLVPGAASVALLDCGSAAGLALAALASGAEAIRLEAPPALLEKIDQIARLRGAALFAAAPDDPLDLADAKDPMADLLARLRTAGHVTEQP